MSRHWYRGVIVILREPEEEVKCWEAVANENGLSVCSNSQWDETRFFPWHRVVEVLGK